MDAIFLIRAGIFLAAGLLVLLFPKQIIKLPAFVFDKLKIKYDYNKELKYYPYVGWFFILIAVGLFVYAFKY